MHIANNHRNQYKTSRDMRLGR
ncbi:Protein CBG22543 [Caenorhabditis briggsae]|nr:Protein CBG22543 [Caenorhabditis briggsae]CAP39108.2 Protein CBG22543 [Caenorhabditis briggsae]